MATFESLQMDELKQMIAHWAEGLITERECRMKMANWVIDASGEDFLRLCDYVEEYGRKRIV